MADSITDLRSAIEMLGEIDGQIIETDVEVDPLAELSGVYRHIGAGGTVQRPTREGPAMIFNNILGHPDARVIIGLLASRRRVGYLLGCEPKRLGFLLNEAVAHPVAPVEVEADQALCQQIVHRADELGFDVRKLVPAPTNTSEDAGPYITMGMCYAHDSQTGESDVTIHRLCLQGPDTISMYFVPGARHLGVMRERAEALGKPLPISISIGVDPAIEIGACFEPPTTPFGYNELGVAGAIRNEPVKLARCLTIDERCIANAEYVIEGELLPNTYVEEDQNTGTGKAMPEFPGYTGVAPKRVPVIRVKAVTTRRDPIMQTVIGPSEEHVSMAGIPTEASILSMVGKAMPGRVLNVYAASSGGGKYMAVIQFKKSMPSDEGRQRQAAIIAFTAFPELKHVFLVDEDVDPFDMNDVIWAMNTRFQGDADIITIPGVRCHPLDPSADPSCDSSIRDHGISCKTIFDCTVPYDQKERFRRSQFMDVDPAKWVPGFTD
ncbi:Carboxylyase-related protein [Coriobacterium glomerans PW2]|uniref:Carboxylyase-related protein n=1 Tax=Coriobacterium glomerans (strain ATCC 49209 / DSM 20642 / JCM 10262 / PW2) TaxID=700015 RepID=F2N9Z4_CORGP|nr:UbiD family decarboxylase [Coriobacterium glomerans]AEB06249.1 Carboxylyase-related protein [Coriobacterium glomerans PW2]